MRAYSRAVDSRRTPSLGGEYGYILFLVPIILLGLSLLAFQAIQRSRTSMRIAGGELAFLQTRLCAQQCAAVAVNAVSRTLEGNGRVRGGETSCACGAAGGPGAPGDRTGCRTSVGEPAVGSQANCYGQEAARTDVGVAVSCRQDDGAQAVSLKEEVRFEEIPIFQFAVFFDGVLEIHPGQDMDITGRIHSNDTLRIFPAKGTLRLHDWVTSPAVIEGKAATLGGLAAFPLADGSGPGAPLALDGASFQPLHRLITGWDAWQHGHRVAYGDRAGACGRVEPLSLPLKGVADAHALIDWRSESDGEDLRRRKFAWRADLVYRDGWKDRGLQAVSLPGATRPPEERVVLEGGRVVFWEGRDSLMVKVIPVDMRRLQQRAGDSVIYLHDALSDASQGGRDVGGFLLHQGRSLQRPLTVASNSRLYVWGDYNTEPGYQSGAGPRGPYPAALVGDVLTLLSNEWDARDHPRGSTHTTGRAIKAKNPGASATLNACVLAGMGERGGSWSGQGGYHNFIHFIENWKAVDFRFSGSTACLWSSRLSRGAVTTAYYFPPVRKWAFDPMYRGLQHMPPATPRVVTPRLTSWELARNP